VAAVVYLAAPHRVPVSSVDGSFSAHDDQKAESDAFTVAAASYTLLATAQAGDQVCNLEMELQQSAGQIALVEFLLGAGPGQTGRREQAIDLAAGQYRFLVWPESYEVYDGPTCPWTFTLSPAR